MILRLEFTGMKGKHSQPSDRVSIPGGAAEAMRGNMDLVESQLHPRSFFEKEGSMSKLKPGEKVVSYSVVFHEGYFENDAYGFDSSTPFVPIHVGDFISRRCRDIPA